MTIIITTVKNVNTAQSGTIKNGPKTGQPYSIPASLQLAPIEAPYGNMFTCKFEPDQPMDFEDMEQYRGQEIEIAVSQVNVYKAGIVYKGRIITDGLLATMKALKEPAKKTK